MSNGKYFKDLLPGAWGWQSLFTWDKASNG